MTAVVNSNARYVIPIFILINQEPALLTVQTASTRTCRACNVKTANLTAFHFALTVTFQQTTAPLVMTEFTFYTKISVGMTVSLAFIKK